MSSATSAPACRPPSAIASLAGRRWKRIDFDASDGAGPGRSDPIRGHRPRLRQIIQRSRNTMKTLPKYTMGIGDRFAHQGKAQLAAFIKAKAMGVEVAPVWNKSNREHNIVHSVPPSVREEADSAVKALGWQGAYFVDADHIGLKTVDPFIAPSDFFTLDVADFIAKPAAEADIKAFTDAHA